MTFERVERIVYRFTKKEIAALLYLMSIKELKGMDIRAEYPNDQTVESLVRNGIVMPCGDRTFADRTVALVLNTATKSDRYLTAKSSKGNATLFVGREFCVTAENAASDIVKLEPIRNLRSAEKAWLNAVRRFGGNASLKLTCGGTAHEESGDAKAAEALLLRLKDGEV